MKPELAETELYRTFILDGEKYRGGKDRRGVKIDYILDMLPDVSGQRILDIGCAGGGISMALAKRGAIVTAIDIEPKGIAAAKKIAKIHHVDNVNFSVGNLWDMKNKQAYDGVLLLNVLHHEKNQRLSLKLISRLAKKWICIEYPKHPYYSGGKAFHPTKKILPLDWKYIKKDMEKYGFALERLETSPDKFVRGRRRVGFFKSTEREQ